MSYWYPDICAGGQCCIDQVENPLAPKGTDMTEALAIANEWGVSFDDLTLDILPDLRIRVTHGDLSRILAAKAVQVPNALLSITAIRTCSAHTDAAHVLQTCRDRRELQDVLAVQLGLVGTEEAPAASLIATRTLPNGDIEMSHGTVVRVLKLRANRKPVDLNKWVRNG